MPAPTEMTHDIAVLMDRLEAVPKGNLFVVVAPTGTGKTFLVASSRDYVKKHRVAGLTPQDEFPALLEQRRRPGQERQGTTRSLAHQIQPEAFLFDVDARPAGILPTAGEEAYFCDALNKEITRKLIGESPVVYAICPFHIKSVAQHSVRAMAYWSWRERGMPNAGKALLFSLNWHYELGPDVTKIRERHPDFTEAVLTLLNKATWEFNPTATDATERYALVGLTPDEVAEVNDALDAIIDKECDQAMEVYEHFDNVLQTVGRVLITYTKLDGLDFMPGLQIDLVGLANDRLPGRRGLTIISGKYAKTEVVGRGPECKVRTTYSAEAPARLMEAIKAELRAEWTEAQRFDSESRPVPPPLPAHLTATTPARGIVPTARKYRTALAVTAVALPLIALLLELAGWLGSTLTVLGAIALLGLEVAAIVIWFNTQRDKPAERGIEWEIFSETPGSPTNRIPASSTNGTGSH